MRLLLNIIWLVFGGFWLAVGYILAGIVACFFIVTIPAGIASFRMASFALWPFGRTVVEPEEGTSGMSTVGNIVWFILAGVWLAIGHVTTAAAQAITIIGIPLAIANIKMIPVSCFPLGRRVVSNENIPFGWRRMIEF